MTRSVRISFLVLIAALTVAWLKVHTHAAELERATAGARP
jgi:hypothetical protein